MIVFVDPEKTKWSSSEILLLLFLLGANGQELLISSALINFR